MRHITFILLALALNGCVRTRPELTLAHHIRLPKEWSAGSNDPVFPDLGMAERYVSAYDRGWWIAVQNYAKDIDFNDPSALMMNGWAEEAYGGAVGYSEGRDRVERLIRAFGRQKVSEYLQQFKLPDE
ncbi:MAG TPA: hypothetical protein VK846_13090 [Candidatus Limnocylindria bacterium]|nr:hypothetical protein [Candidatus Limnocylindria bacterium]